MIPVKTSPISPMETGQMLIRGIQDLVGEAGVLSLLGLAKVPCTIEAHGIDLKEEISPANLRTIQSFLEAIYGFAGSQGITLRIGRIFFEDLLRCYGGEIGLLNTDILTLPTRKRIRAGLEIISDVVGGAFNHNIQIMDDNQYWYWRVEKCLWCSQPKGTGVLQCPFDTGFLQEYLSWVTGGKRYIVRETECRSNGAAACVTRIDKNPLS